MKESPPSTLPIFNKLIAINYFYFQSYLNFCENKTLKYCVYSHEGDKLQRQEKGKLAHPITFLTVGLINGATVTFEAFTVN